MDLDEKPKQPKVDSHFERDRQKFCLSEKEGGEYLLAKGRMEQLSNVLKEIEEKKKTNKVLTKIKKLNIVELEKLLGPALEKDNYSKLDFSKPEIAKDVIVNFTVQDNKMGRGEYDSKIGLQRLIKKIFEETNWRLMSEGVNYRLGILSGRLRGYEREDDLLKLLK